MFGGWICRFRHEAWLSKCAFLLDACSEPKQNAAWWWQLSGVKGFKALSFIIFSHTFWDALSPFAFGSLACQQCALQVRVVERSTEGIHSVVKRALQRAPAASVSYLSLDLRFTQLAHAAIVEPRLFADAIQNLFPGLSTHIGFRDGVCKLLNIRPNRYVNGLTQRELADLLYRENLSLKHSAAGQIRHAVAAAGDLLNTSLTEPDENTKKRADVLSASLVDFLIEVLGALWALMWTWGARWFCSPFRQFRTIKLN